MESKQQVIIIGGGLAGLSAAHSVIQNGGKVLILEKKMTCGGSSVCATSGINGALTSAQKNLNIYDSAEKFCNDTAKSAALGDENAQPSELCKILTYKSAHAIEWLSDVFKIDLSKVTRLGGHSEPRTHRGKEKMPGMTITNTLLEKLKEIQKESNGDVATIEVKAEAQRLLIENGAVIGVEYIKNKKSLQVYGAVIICTGGFAADFSKNSLLLKYRPDLAKFSTTNPNHANGDGIRMCETIGADLVDMEYIQVHPTGLVNEKEPNAKQKILAAEALRGVGGIILNANGERFCNELGRRDYVSGCMIANKAPFRQVLNSKSCFELEWHIKHYVGRGLMKKMTGAELAASIGITPEKLQESFNKYKESAKKGTDEYDKKFFPNYEAFDISDTFHVSIVTPVVHYTMGGVHIDSNSNIIGKDSKPIPGLYAAGEVCGAVHGKNRLGGNSLLDCVVFGILCGQQSVLYLKNKNNSRAGSRLETINKQLK